MLIKLVITKTVKENVSSRGKRVTDPIEPADNTIKNPDDWKTGDEPLTGAQNSYLHTLASEAHVEVEEGLSKAAASKKIDELRKQTGRGINDENVEAEH